MAQSQSGPLDPQIPQDYKRTRLERFDGGIRQSVQPEAIQDNELSDASQLFWYDGQLLVDSGYAAFGPTLEGVPHVPYQIYYPDGTSQLLLLTTTTVYVLSDGSPPQWQYAGYGGLTTLTLAVVAAGATNFPVTNAEIFYPGAPLTLQLSNGNTYITTVASIGGSIIHIAGSVPAPGMDGGAYVRIILPPMMLTTAVAIGDTSIEVSSAAFVAHGSKIGVNFADGTQWQFVVDSVTGASNLTINAEPGQPGAPQAAPINTPVVLAPVLTGNINIQPLILAYPANGWVIISNGVDPIKYFFQGTLYDLPGLPDGTTAQAMNVFHTILCIGNLVENGTAFPHRIRRSDIGDPTMWLPIALGAGRGIAAIDDLVDTEDFILSLNLLGPWMLAYRETSIMRASFLGLPGQTIFWEYMVFGEGIQSQGSVAEIGESHFLVGTQGIYLYSGGYELRSIGDNIFSQFLSAKGNLNASAKSTIFVQYVADQDEVFIFYPATPALLPNSMLRCSLEKTAWYPRTFGNNFIGGGFYLPLKTTTWASAIGTWQQNTAAWNSRVFLLNAPTIILATPDTPQVFVYDYNTPGDNGAALQWELILKDVGDGDVLQRFDSVVFYGKGQGITIQYALDPPQETDSPIPVVYTTKTDQNGKPFTLNFGAGGLSRQRVTFDLTGTYLRLLLTGMDASFTLSYAEVWYAFEGEY